jgi:hypothetical protein
MESVFDRICSGEFLSGSQAKWIRDTYSCIHCFSKTHGTESCHKLENLYLVTKHPGGEGSHQPPAPGAKPPYKPKTTFKGPASGGAGRKTTEESGTKPAPTPSVTFAPSVKPPGEQSPVANIVTTVDDDSESVADESDDAFNLYDTIATSDEDLVHSIAQIQARRTESQQNMLQAPSNTPTPIPISSRKDKTMAKMAKADLTWLRDEKGGTELHWNSDVTQALNILVNQSSIYDQSALRTLCPHSGATSNMCPHRDMFVDYRDIREERQYVRLGDENKRILIHGRGTMVLKVDGRTLAYAHTLHVPQLSVILLSTRVHRRLAVGCSFLDDSPGCFLTYSNFQIKVDDTADCTILCRAVPVDTHTYDFDTR